MPGALEGEPTRVTPARQGLRLTRLSHLLTPSVASAMHGDSHDRYERLTSVSSSVDFDQRDNVSALPGLLHYPWRSRAGGPSSR